MPGAGTWIKMGITGAVLCIGGPALVIWVSPTQEELFKRYNPELQKRSLEGREQRAQEFDNFVMKLKKYSKSDKHLWVAAAEDEARQRAEIAEERKQIASEIEKRRDEIRRHSLSKD